MCQQKKLIAFGEPQPIENDTNVLEADNFTKCKIYNSYSFDGNDEMFRMITPSVANATLIAATIISLSSLARLMLDSSDIINSDRVLTSIDFLQDFIERMSNTAFYQAFSLVLVSEIGDKTFFIACLIAMKGGRFVSFVGTICALAVLTVLSVIVGQLFSTVPHSITQGVAICDLFALLAFSFFGVKTLKEAYEIQDGGSSGIEEEFADAEQAVEGGQSIIQLTVWGKIISTFGLVFVAEFGDRSFISTIALSAAQNSGSVAAGAIVAHAIATAIAVISGPFVAKYISERAISYIGGSLFLIFAITTAIGLL